MHKRLFFFAPILLVGCGLPILGDSDDGEATSDEGSAMINISGGSIVGSWELEGTQTSGDSDDPDTSKAISLYFSSPGQTPSDEPRIVLTLDLAGAEYAQGGLKRYECGINVLESGETTGPLCYMAVRYYPGSGRAGGVWAVGPDRGAHPNCWFEVESDSSKSFAGSFSCDAMNFNCTESLAEFFNCDPEFPEKATLFNIDGDWAFPYRKSFTFVD